MRGGGVSRSEGAECNEGRGNVRGGGVSRPVSRPEGAECNEGRGCKQARGCRM